MLSYICYSPAESLRCDRSINLLTSSFKPPHLSNAFALLHALPHVLPTLLQSKGTSHKRLQWTHVLGNAVVKATFGKHSYDLQVHTLQAIALMEFNATKGEVHTQLHTYAVT